MRSAIKEKNIKTKNLINRLNFKFILFFLREYVREKNKTIEDIDDDKAKPIKPKFKIIEKK